MELRKITSPEALASGPVIVGKPGSSIKSEHPLDKWKISVVALQRRIRTGYPSHSSCAKSVSQRMQKVNKIDKFR